MLGKDRADGIGRGATGEATTCWVFELFPHRPAALLPMLTLIHLGGPSTPWVKPVSRKSKGLNQGASWASP